MALFGKTVEAVTEKFAYLLVDQAKKNINKKAPYAKKGKINTTGKLKNSIKYKMEPEGVSIFMEDYGILRDAGQLGRKKKILKGWNKSIFVPRGQGFTSKQPPIAPIKKWIQRKGLKYDPKTPQGLSQTAFLISRKIFNEGIQPGLFMSTPFNKLYPKYLDDLDKALGDDVDILIEENID